MLSGDTARPYLTEGVGEDFFPGTYDPSVVDRWVRVSDRDAFAMARRLTREEGILAGRLVRDRDRRRAARSSASWPRRPTGRDGGRRRAAARQRPELPVQDLQRRVDAGERPAGRRPAPSSGSTTCSTTATTPGRSRTSCIARTTQRVGEAIATLQEYSGSASCRSRSDPDGDAIEGFVGSITEKGLLDRAFRDPSIVERTVGEVMDRPLPLVDVAASLDEAFALLSDGSSAVIATSGRPPGRRRDQARRARVPGPPPDGRG